MRQKFAEMEAKETTEGATDQAPEADTMGAPAEGHEVAESEAVADFVAVNIPAMVCTYQTGEAPRNEHEDIPDG